MSERNERPNFLFFLPDQHRFDWVPWQVSGRPAAEQAPVRMPTLEGIAARGVRFDRAVCASPVCAPSRACLASGREYERCGVRNNHDNYPSEQPTYYRRLRDVGYRVAGVGKFDLHKATMDWGLDGTRLLREWGFTEGVDNEGKMDAIASYAGHRTPGGLGGAARGGQQGGMRERGPKGPKGPYMAFLQERGLAEVHVADFEGRRGVEGHHRTHPTPLPDDAYCDNWIAANGLRFLEGFPAGHPWHLVVNFTGPHSPMDVTAAMHARWQGVRFPGPMATDAGGGAGEVGGGGGHLSAEEHNAVRQNYAAMLENIDTQMERFLEVVRARGDLERTVIVYSSDHGEMLGDHHRWGKSTYFHPSVGVPLVVAGPGVSVGQQGTASEALVSMHDLAATFLEAAGAEALPGMDSRSLAPVLRGQSTIHREHVRSGLDDWRMVWDGRHKLVRIAGKSEEETRTLLFDLEADPWETRDLAGEGGQATRVRALEGVLGDWGSGGAV